MARFPVPKKFTPKHPEKWIGDLSNIIMRSSWERKFAVWADTNPAITRVCSEHLVIPYFSEVDQKMHRYFTDFAIIVDRGDGLYQKYLIEIKPKVQTLPPKRGNRATNKYIKDLATYSVNMAKWRAAEAYCTKQGMKFMVLTEEHLFGTK